ncbi:restriction endonuclease subunit S [Streptococcus macedonicus]|uniref:Restriction endonuclease subunit S n=1 Tax=Streptococcus macedonicus TaxID=59310 RepID=A0A2G3NQC0_STRMC|nr:restriction endonuclease subunit S [Streptococcus macedonicus]PHV55706.1 restriction endonuclease subunit S [Streptococcus macedonicus]
MAKIDDSVKKKVPELRFPGFTDDWEDCKLGELASFSKGNGYTKNDLVEFGDPIILYGRLYTKYETVIEKVDTFVNKKDKSIISEGSEVIVPASGESSEDISRASVVGKSGIILGGDLNIIKPVNYIDSIFLALTISNGSQQKEMSKRAQGKSVVHLHNSDLKQVNILYPKLEEQQKIGAFFQSIDDTIALHQRKLDLLKEQKKGFLQKMFPKNGAKVPELRFAGFADDWEERKLGELSNIVGGGTPSTSNPEYWDGDIDWYAPAEIGEQSYVSKSKKTITELGLKKSSARILPVGTVLFTSRAGIGNTAILAKEATTNQGFQSIVPDQNKLDSYFIFSRTNELKRYGEVTGAGSTFVEVSGKQMSKMSIMVPELSEQQKIGSFFKQLDDTIALHQRKLDLLKEQKKGFLQKMFV